VGVRLHEDLIAGFSVAANGQLIGHGSGRHKQRRLFAQQLRRLAFERLDRGVITEYVVAHLGSDHRLAHGRCRFGHRVAAQVNQLRCLFRHGDSMQHPGRPENN
jgi:hypothetical protein